MPRDLYGRELAAALCRSWGYQKVNQVGSHIILQTKEPVHHRLSVPDHKPLRLGTLNVDFTGCGCGQAGDSRGDFGFVVRYDRSQAGRGSDLNQKFNVLMYQVLVK